jgi:hypothetical protein
MSLEVIKTIILQKDYPTTQNNIIRFTQDFQEKKEETFEKKEKPKSRCNKCNTKVNITNSLECKCGKLLCMTHRHFNSHNCSIDYKEKDKKILEKNNPKVVAEKIIKL